MAPTQTGAVTGVTLSGQTCIEYPESNSKCNCFRWFQTPSFILSENVNFLIADGVKFAHPLHHLGKSKADLPLIAIDRLITYSVQIGYMVHCYVFQKLTI